MDKETFIRVRNEMASELTRGYVHGALVSKFDSMLSELGYPVPVERFWQYFNDKGYPQKSSEWAKIHSHYMERFESGTNKLLATSGAAILWDVYAVRNGVWILVDFICHVRSIECNTFKSEDQFNSGPVRCD